MRAVAIATIAAILGGVLWYLHDPPWLIDQTTGLRAAERAPDGTVYRWSGGHASFFVPSDGAAIRIPLATTFDARGAEPMVVSVFVDDVRAGLLLLTDDRWQSLSVPLPARGSRRVRRIDIRTTLVRDDNHGVKIGRVDVLRQGD